MGKLLLMGSCTNVEPFMVDKMTLRSESLVLVHFASMKTMMRSKAHGPSYYGHQVALPDDGRIQ